MRTRKYRKRGGDGIIDTIADFAKNPIETMKKAASKAGESFQTGTASISASAQSFANKPLSLTFEEGKAAIEKSALDLQNKTTEFEQGITSKAAEVTSNIQATARGLTTPTPPAPPAPPAPPELGGKRRKSKRKRPKRRTRR